MSMRSQRISSAVQASTGTFFEAYDLIVFGSFAGIIGENFFPSANKYTSVMFGFMTFAAAYVMRVAGAIILGPYIDRAGRRKGLILSLTLIAIGTGIIASTPTYTSIGIFAPILMIVGRLIQGFSIGGETGGVAAYLVEVATQGRRALYMSWTTICFQLAAVSAIGLAYFLNETLSARELSEWGWRIPFIVGCGVVPIIFVMRKRLVESDQFIAQTHRRGMKEILSTLMSNWRFVLAGMFMVALGSSLFYFLLTYMPIFAYRNLRLGSSDSSLSTIYVSLYCLVMTPLFAMLSDRFGRYPILVASALLVVFTAYPSLQYLTAEPSFKRLVLVQLWYASLYCAYSSSSFVSLSEWIPTELRATGYGLSTSLGLAVFGGFTPLVAAWLVHNTGNDATPSVWLMALAVCALVAVWLLVRGKIAMSCSVSVGSVAESRCPPVTPQGGNAEDSRHASGLRRAGVVSMSDSRVSDAKSPLLSEDELIRLVGHPDSTEEI